MKFGNMPVISYEGDPIQYKDMYLIVVEAFEQAWYSGLYVISMFALAFHLYHGFQSGFQRLNMLSPNCHLETTHGSAKSSSASAFFRVLKM
jgi:hypothetical protein